MECCIHFHTLFLMVLPETAAPFITYDIHAVFFFWGGFGFLINARLNEHYAWIYFSPPPPYIYFQNRLRGLEVGIIDFMAEYKY